MKEILKLWRNIFSNWKYPLVLIAIAFAFFMLNVVIRNYSSILSSFTSMGFLGTVYFLFNLSLGFNQTLTLSSFITVILIGILIGFFFTLVIYKTQVVIENKKIGHLGTLGIALGIIAPGCAACGIGLLTLFGISAGVLASLPLKGLELSLLSILILTFSSIKLSKDLLGCKICKINLK